MLRWEGVRAHDVKIDTCVINVSSVQFCTVICIKIRILLIQSTKIMTVFSTS